MYALTVKTSIKDDDLLTQVRQNMKKDTDGEKERVCGCISADNWEIFVTLCLVAFELFQVLMACLLAMFVPQKCWLEKDGSSRTCTTDDIFNPPEGIKNSYLTSRVLILNFVTLAVALLHYLYMYRREKALVHLLQNSFGTPNDRLPEILPFYPEVRNMLYGHHFRVTCTATMLALLFGGNSAISAILVFGYRSVELQPCFCLFIHDSSACFFSQLQQHDDCDCVLHQHWSDAEDAVQVVRSGCHRSEQDGGAVAVRLSPAVLQRH